jgi:hypothetical protein
LNETRETLETALRNDKWEFHPNPQLASLVHYNLACCLCRLTATDPKALGIQTPMLDRAVTSLQEACKYKQTRVQTALADFKAPDGDLYILDSNSYYTNLAREIRREFEQNWT